MTSSPTDQAPAALVPVTVAHRMAVSRRPRKSILKLLGPGIITGASDDDPSGIATYSQAGAQFGYAMCWVMLFSFPLMAGIQEICGRIGRVTGKGIAANLREHRSAALLRVIVGLLLIANTANLGADLGAMADVLALLIGGPVHVYVVLFAVGCVLLEVFSSYGRYVTILKWACLSLFAYVATALVVGVDWRAVLMATLVPDFSFKTDYIVTIVAVLGTTITPYCFFWQSSEEAEEERLDATMAPLTDAPEQAPDEIRRIRIDTWFGMGYSNAVSLFIIVTTAATLHAGGITDIQTSAQAAEALRPIAGELTFFVFAFGVIGIGLLAVPVLAGSSAYALGEALGWTTGLGRLPKDARAFYAAIAASTLVGIGINLVGINPIKALIWAAVLNGIVAVPLMVVIMGIGSDQAVMGRFILPTYLRAMGWACTAVMAVAVAIMFATL